MRTGPGHLPWWARSAGSLGARNQRRKKPADLSARAPSEAWRLGKAAYRMINENATDSGLAPGSATRRHHDPEAYCEQLEWLLVSGDAATGARGTMGGVVARLEHGGQFTGVPETDIYSDQQIGWGKTVVGLVEKRRWLMGAWFSLPADSQGRLALCYNAPRAEHRSDEVTHHHSGLAAQLGRYAALAFHLTDEPGSLLEACRQPTKGKNGR